MKELKPKALQPRAKTQSSIEIVADIDSEARKKARESRGLEAMRRLQEEGERVIHSRIILPRDITRLTPIWEVVDRYISYKRAQGMSEITIKNVEVFVDNFYTFLALKTIPAEELATFTKEELLSHVSILPIMVLEQDNIDELYKLYLIEERGNKESSVWQMMSRYVAFYRYCSDVLECINPKKFVLQQPQQKIKPLYSNEQMDKLLEKPQDYKKNFKAHRDWLIIMYVYNTGNRRRSIANIQMKDLAELEEGFIIINTTKNKKPQRIVIPQRLVMLIKEYISIWRYDTTKEDYLFTNEYGEQLSGDNLSKIVKRHNEKILGKGCPTSIHLFRHQYAAEYIKDEGSMFDLQKQLGHSTLNMVKYYAEHYGKPNKENIESHAPINRRKNTTMREKIKPRG